MGIGNSIWSKVNIFYKESFHLLGLCLGKHLTLAYFLKIRTLFFHVFIYLASRQPQFSCLSLFSAFFNDTHWAKISKNVSLFMYSMTKIPYTLEVAIMYLRVILGFLTNCHIQILKMKWGRPVCTLLDRKHCMLHTAIEVKLP